SLELSSLNLQRAVARNAVTIAALASAIAMTIGVSIMIYSFRQTVNGWINSTLVADLFVTPSSNEIAGPSSFLSPEVVSFFEAHPSVLAVDTFRYTAVPFRSPRMAIAAIRAAGPRHFEFVSGTPK